MEKSLKMIVLLAIVAISSLSVNQAYAQEIDVATDIPIIESIAVVAVIIGSVISVVDGYTSRTTKTTGFATKKLLSALITSIMGAITMINFGAIPDQTNGLSILGVFVSYLILGWGTDKGLARLDK